MRVLIPLPPFESPKYAKSLSGQFYEEVMNIAQYLDKVYVITAIEDRLKKSGVAKIGNVEVHQIKSPDVPKLKGTHRIMAFAVKLLLLIRRVDCVFVRTFSPAEATSLIIAKFLGKPRALLISGTWDLEPSTIKNKIYRFLFKIAVSLPDVIILYSQRMINPVRRYAPSLDLSRIRIIRNAVNTERFKPGLNSDYLRRELGIGSDEKVILFVGRIVEHKGIEEIIRAAPMVVNVLPKVKFLIVGNNEPNNLKFRSRLEKLAKKLRVSNNIIFAGAVRNELIPYYNNLADIFVIPSRSGEGITRAMLEAMSCEVPVISTDVAGNPDAVINGVTGFIIPTGDYEALASRIIKLLNDDELRAGIAKNARRMVVERFSMDKNVPKLVETLKEIS